VILVIDNYDSFTYNLVQYLGELGADPVVKRNDEIAVRDIAALSPAAVVISPGPGTPHQAGISMDVVRDLGGELPLLGVCLGHQAIAEVYGGKVVRAPKLMHGKTSWVNHAGTGLFEGIESPIEVMRYHSLTVDPESVPDVLEITAWGKDDSTEIHALKHRELRVWGVQFHPESVMTKSGKRILGNFLRLAVSGLAIAIAALTAVPVNGQTPEPELDTSYVIYDKGPITLPFGVGLHIPSYNRVDGVVVPWGPDIKFAGGKIHLVPTVTWRTHIGKFDPEITGRIALGPLDSLEFSGGRSTFTNDGWMRSDLINSLAAIGVGTDARNYFRADRGQAEFFHSFVQPVMRITPSIGVLHEFAWSTGVPVAHTSAPWSVFGRKDTLKLRRINPAIARGHTTSGLAGVRIDYDDNVTKGRLSARVEHAFDTPPVLPSSDESFTQFTVDAKAEFPTFGTQSFEFRGHAVFTGGDAPPQRYAYLGSGGTLSTVDLLAFGGDRLLYVEGEYKYPLKAPIIQFVGAPVLSLRYAAGSAGVDELPELIQNISAGISLKVIKAEYHFDPSYNETPVTKKSKLSVSFSLPF
jgi:anthranilate synthase/aminodeoxychorismate synthase-like glutamine amidotransferase